MRFAPPRKKLGRPKKRGLCNSIEGEAMAKTTVLPGNPWAPQGGNMPSTTGNQSGGNRGNNPPHGSK